jgi:O-antigen ligase
MIFKSLNFFKWSLLLFSFSFSLGIAINSVAFGALVLVSIITFVGDCKLKEIICRKKQFYFPLVFFFLVISVREYIVDVGNFLYFLNRYSPFLLFVIIIGVFKNRVLIQIRNILGAFVYGMILNLIVNFAYAVYRGIIIHQSGINFWFFTYDFFAEPFSIQPIYLAFFYVFSIFILIYDSSYIKKKSLYFSIIFFLILGVFLLAARNAIACLIILTPLFLFFERKVSFKTICILGFSLIVAFIIAIQNPVVKNRIFKVTEEGNVYSGSSLRKKIWTSAIEVSKENLFFGLGEKESMLKLQEQYRLKEMSVPLKERYHSHNTYLQILIQYGLLGLISLLILFLAPLRKFYLSRHFLALAWIVLFMIASITEAFFMRQWGIFSFAFFTSIFLISGNDNN